MLVQQNLKSFEFFLNESQHVDSKWTHLNDFEKDQTIHPLSKLFLKGLKGKKL